MHKTYVLLSIIILTTFLTSCAGTAIAQANEATLISAPATAEPMAVPEILSKSPPASCPLTVPQDPAFVPPAPMIRLVSKVIFGLAPIPCGRRCHRTACGLACQITPAALRKRYFGGARDTSGMKNLNQI